MIAVFEYIYRNSIESFYLKKLYMNTALEIQQTFYEIYFGLLLKLRNDLHIIYFVLFLIAIYFDHRFERIKRIERWARLPTQDS